MVMTRTSDPERPDSDHVFQLRSVAYYLWPQVLRLRGGGQHCRGGGRGEWRCWARERGRALPLELIDTILCDALGELRVDRPATVCVWVCVCARARLCGELFSGKVKSRSSREQVCECRVVDEKELQVRGRCNGGSADPIGEKGPLPKVLAEL